MLYFKDSKDGYYQFDDNAPKEWYVNLIACDKQLELPKSADQLAQEAKALKVQQLDSITVTISTGKTFDGNEVSRGNMLAAISAADYFNQTSATWKLSDNTVALVTLAEIQEALALSIKRVGEIVTL